MFVWVLFLFAGLLALLLLLLGSACRFRATLQLEPAGGHLELQTGYLLLSQRFRFRVSLLSAPYLTVEWLRTDGSVRPVYRAFESQKKPSPWAEAAWAALHWERVEARLEVGDATAPALSTLTYGALYLLLQYALCRYLTPKTILCGAPCADGALFRLKVEGIAKLVPAQIILEKIRKKRRIRHVTSN